jgi:hypothetical protein
VDDRANALERLDQQLRAELEDITRMETENENVGVAEELPLEKQWAHLLPEEVVEDGNDADDTAPALVPTLAEEQVSRYAAPVIDLPFDRVPISAVAVVETGKVYCVVDLLSDGFKPERERF